MSPVCHSLISLSSLSALLLLSLPPLNSCHSSLLSSVVCFFIQTHCPGVLSSAGQPSGLTSEFLFLSLEFCCTPMLPWPPSRTDYPNKEERDCPAQWGQYPQTHTSKKTWHGFVLVSVWEHTCGSFLCLRADPLPRNVALSHTQQKPAMSAFVQKEEEVQTGSTEESLHTHRWKHIYFLTSYAVLFDPMCIVRSGQGWIKDVHWPSEHTPLQRVSTLASTC